MEKEVGKINIFFETKKGLSSEFIPSFTAKKPQRASSIVGCEDP